MKKQLTIDVSTLVEAIELLTKEVQSMKKILAENNSVINTSNIVKVGPKQNGKFYNTKYEVKTIKLGYNINIVPNENSHAGKKVTPPRILGRDWDDFPFVIASSLTISFIDINKCVYSISRSALRELINTKEELVKYLNNWYVTMFNLVIEEIKKQSKDGKLVWQFKSYDLNTVVDLLEEKKIELHQL